MINSNGTFQNKAVFTTLVLVQRTLSYTIVPVIFIQTSNKTFFANIKIRYIPTLLTLRDELLSSIAYITMKRQSNRVESDMYNNHFSCL